MVTGEPGGFQINLGASNEFDARSADGFFEAAVLDERSAPPKAALPSSAPSNTLGLLRDTNILNRELGNSQGDMNSGKGLYSIAGISIRKSNNSPSWLALSPLSPVRIPLTMVTSPTAVASSSTVKQSVVEAIAPSIETTSGDFHVQYQGDLIVGKLAMGAGSLRTSVAGAFRNV